jgi:DnaA-homolog protein
MTTNEQQLVLNLRHPDIATFSNFYPGDNNALLTILQNITNNQLMHYMYLWGEKGCGKTHLLMSCCAHHREKNLATAYIPLHDLKGSSPHILENLENIDVVCLDDLDEVAHQPQWAESILHCFNRVQQLQHHIIISAKATPSALICQLADLTSRLASGIIHKIQPLNNVQKMQALQLCAAQRGLILPTPTATFLLNHCDRDTTSLFTMLKKLDLASLQTQRNLTIPFVKQVLGI